MPFLQEFGVAHPVGSEASKILSRLAPGDQYADGLHVAELDRPYRSRRFGTALLAIGDTADKVRLRPADRNGKDYRSEMELWRNRYSSLARRVFYQRWNCGSKVMRNVLLALLASAGLATSAQAVTYAQYDITVFGNHQRQSNIDPSDYTETNFIRDYVINVASDEPHFFSLGFEISASASSLLAIVPPNIFNEGVSVTTSLSPIDDLPNITTSSIVSSNFFQNLVIPGGIYGDMWVGQVKFASTQFSDTTFGVSGITEIDQVFPTPEPATWALMVAGFGVIGFAMRWPRAKGQRKAWKGL